MAASLFEMAAVQPQASLNFPEPLTENPDHERLTASWALRKSASAWRD